MIFGARDLSALAIVSLLLVPACRDEATGVSSNDFSACESFRFAFGRENRSTFVLSGISGDIALEESSTDSIIIQGERRVESDSEGDAQAQLPSLQVEVTEMASEVRAETIQPRESRRRNYVVDYLIALPADLSVEIEAVNGEVIVRSLRAPVAVSSVNGVISARDIEATSVGLALVNGVVDASIVLPPDAAASMSTVNGNIELSIPAETSAGIEATVLNGLISVSGLSTADLTVEARSVRGRLGEGDGSIALSTVNGNIILRGL